MDYRELIIAINRTIVQSVDDKEVLHSWQKINPESARYPADMTPLILAAQRNNYEILKLLLDRGTTLPMPHDVKCGCEDCLRSAAGQKTKLCDKQYKKIARIMFLCIFIIHYQVTH